MSFAASADPAPASPAVLAAPDALWVWAGMAYGRPGAKAACLSLQDDFGLDVDVLLWLMWLADLGRRPTPAAWEQAAALSEDWRSHVFEPLRRARRALNAPRRGVEDPARRELYAAALALELKLERTELDALARLTSETAPMAGEPRLLARAHLDAYAMGAGAEPALDALIAAVFT